MTAAAVAVNFDAILKGVKRLARVNPDRAKAVEKIVAYYLKDERAQAKVDRARTERRQIDRRLMLAHECRSVFVGFTQLPSAASGARSWRCLGCRQVVTL